MRSRYRKSFWDQAAEMTPGIILRFALATATIMVLIHGFSGLVHGDDVPFSSSITNWLWYFVSFATSSWVFSRLGQYRLKKNELRFENALQKRVRAMEERA